jgi:hypothetical protein
VIATAGPSEALACQLRTVAARMALEGAVDIDQRTFHADEPW